MTADGYRTVMSLAEDAVLKPEIDSVLPFAGVAMIIETWSRGDIAGTLPAG